MDQRQIDHLERMKRQTEDTKHDSPIQQQNLKNLIDQEIMLSHLHENPQSATNPQQAPIVNTPETQAQEQ